MRLAVCVLALAVPVLVVPHARATSVKVVRDEQTGKDFRFTAAKKSLEASLSEAGYDVVDADKAAADVVITLSLRLVKSKSRARIELSAEALDVKTAVVLAAAADATGDFKKNDRGKEMKSLKDAARRLGDSLVNRMKPAG